MLITLRHRTGMYHRSLAEFLLAGVDPLGAVSNGHYNFPLGQRVTSTNRKIEELRFPSLEHVSK